MVYAATRWVFWIRITRHIRHWDSHGPSGAVLPGLVVLLEHTHNEDVQRCIHDIHDIHDIHVEFVMDIPPDITWISWTVSFSRTHFDHRRISSALDSAEPTRQIDFGKHITRPWPLCAFWTVFVFKKHRESKWWYKNNRFWSNSFLSK